MTLLELGSNAAVRDFITANANAVVTFSAHWCGPCKASKPELQELAARLAADPSLHVKMGIVYESDLGESIHHYGIKAFPTHVLFQNGSEKAQVIGANVPAVGEMIQQAGCKATLTGGETLGGGAVAMTPEQARAARLAKLGATAAAPSPAPEPADSKDADMKEPESATADVDMKEEPDSTTMDAEMKDAEPAAPGTDPTAQLDPEAVQLLTESMGFSLLRAQKGLLHGTGGSVEGAIEWLTEHQDDADIDDPIPPTTAAAKAMSYKCNECGKILSNMANLELHANKTGHSDFAESTEQVKPLSAEEKAAKIAEIKELLKAKRQEREDAEKVDETEREKQRRFTAKEMKKTKEQLEIEQRKRDALARKREKEAYKKERERIRMELAKDKAERQAHGGKLSSKLGVEGYHPDAIKYDDSSDSRHHENKKLKGDAAKIDEYIAKVSAYRAGGDGGKCLKVLKAYVGNVVDNPTEEKFKTIKMDNKAFKTKVKPFVGAKSLLVAVGFQQNKEGDALVLKEDADSKVLADTKEKLERALVAYG